MLYPVHYTSDGVNLAQLAAEFGEGVPGDVLTVLGEQPKGLVTLVAGLYKLNSVDP
jgi:hypothetical protein